MPFSMLRSHSGPWKIPELNKGSGNSQLLAFRGSPSSQAPLTLPRQAQPLPGIELLPGGRPRSVSSEGLPHPALQQLEQGIGLPEAAVQFCFREFHTE